MPHVQISSLERSYFIYFRELRIPEILVRYPSDDAVNREEIPPEKPMDPEHE